MVEHSVVMTYALPILQTHDQWKNMEPCTEQIKNTKCYIYAVYIYICVCFPLIWSFTSGLQQCT